MIHELWRWRRRRVSLGRPVLIRLLEDAVRVDQVGELDEVLVDRVLVHLLLDFVSLLLVLVRGLRLIRRGPFLSIIDAVSKNSHVHLLEAAKWVNGTAVSLWSLEEVLSSRVQSLVRVLSGAAPASATRWRISELAIRPLRVLLLHVSVERGVRQVRLLAVLALEVPALVVVLGPSLADLPRAVLVLVLVV